MSINIKELDKNGAGQFLALEKYGLTTFQLKIIAMAAMLIDHIAVMFVNSDDLYYVLRAIGRISFPIFAFLIVEGFFHTSNKKKYAARLGIFAVISEIPFDLAFEGQLVYFQKQNVFVTLLIGLLGIWGLHTVAMGGVRYHKKLVEALGFGRLQSLSRFSIMIAACGAGHLMGCTYSFAGIFLIICFYVFYEHHIGKIFANAFFNIVMYGGIQCFGTFSAVPIFLYNGKPGNKKWKWFFYLFYPAHLLLLTLGEVLLKYCTKI